MNYSDSKSGDQGTVGNPDTLDVETLIAKIRRDPSVSVTRLVIQEVLNEVIPKYKSARIQTFVPILIHREAIKRLKSRQIPEAAPTMTTYEAIENTVAVDLVEEAVVNDVGAAELGAAIAEEAIAEQMDEPEGETG